MQLVSVKDKYERLFKLLIADSNAFRMQMGKYDNVEIMCDECTVQDYCCVWDAALPYDFTLGNVCHDAYLRYWEQKGQFVQEDIREDVQDNS